jgi:hypothetical protein
MAHVDFMKDPLIQGLYVCLISGLFGVSPHKDQGLDMRDMWVILTQVMKVSRLCKVCVMGHWISCDIPLC